MRMSEKIMGKIFKYREYNYDVDNMINAIHSWLVNTKGVNLKKDFHIKIEQTAYMDLQKGVDEYG